MSHNIRTYCHRCGSVHAGMCNSFKELVSRPEQGKQFCFECDDPNRCASAETCYGHHAGYPKKAEQGRREGLCDDCRREYPTPWFAANELWNRVIPDRQGMLCPNCFIRRAQKAGIDPTGWEIREEVHEVESPEQGPKCSHDRLDEDGICRGCGSDCRGAFPVQSKQDTGSKVNWQKQLIVGENGDCLRAAFANCLGFRVESMPHYEQDAWFDHWTVWFKERGIGLIWYSFRPGIQYVFPGLYILSVKSPRLEGHTHCVIAKDGVVVFDPHPNADETPADPNTAIGAYLFHILEPDKFHAVRRSSEGVRDALRLCLPYVKNWHQANEDGWIEKKYKVIELVERALSEGRKE